MKTSFVRFTATQSAVVLFLCFFFINKGLSQDYKKGISLSTFSATAGYQSISLSWAPVLFPSSTALQAGYLLIYSTSTPSLVNAPDGRAPNYTILNGTVVPTTATNLPIQPATFAIASGLADGSTYNFMLLAYTWDGINPSSYQYSSPVTICATIPPDGPGKLNLVTDSVSSMAISGLIDQPLLTPDGYMVIYSTSSTAPAIVNGHIYEQGDVFGMDTVVQVSSSNSFNTIHSGYNLSPSTTYYIYAFSYSVSGCNKTPVYSSDYVTDSITTLKSRQPTAVVFNYFTATKENGYNRLVWGSACPVPRFTFEVQKSFDSINFTSIDTLGISGDLGCSQPFTYNDNKNIEAAKIYYRIKITYGNGNASFSNTAIIRTQIGDIESIHVIQNPVQNDAHFQVISSRSDDLELILTNIEGRRLLKKTVKIWPGMCTIHLPAANLAKGMYFVIGIFGNGKICAGQFIKL
ncbi:MAG TPA: hypothetical protein VKT28_05640 [Puia sp.]|nr:hypothetical protein [Puia sp.]